MLKNIKRFETSIKRLAKTYSTTWRTSLGDLEDGALLEATSHYDAITGLAQVIRMPCPTEDGGQVKMEVP